MGSWEAFESAIGGASAVNLACLRRPADPIIAAPKSELKKFGSTLASADAWRTIYEGFEINSRAIETEQTVILCRSADRRSKGHARQVQPADRKPPSRAGPLCGSLKTKPRSGASELADQASFATKPACRPLHHEAGGGCLHGRLRVAPTPR
jgi:hypothetical protein